ncbi:EF-hand domain-containing protein [Neolewinella aurantiaca]|uniref:EF-hand domain-containing protein n=2 Tax=Neolewinella aurantiaca TaxID=2602767 RepID=A0A5C7F8Q0_9BACT|nr:EF-hand domain-containing protein [Neolewinella aurantiaca]
MLLAAVGCNSTKTAATEEKAAVEQRGERPQRGGERKSPEEMFAEMDTNKDGKLAKDEVSGRLAENFTTIDADSDGFLSVEEIKNARPARGGRPGGGRPGGDK